MPFEVRPSNSRSVCPGAATTGELIHHSPGIPSLYQLPGLNLFVINNANGRALDRQRVVPSIGCLVRCDHGWPNRSLGPMNGGRISGPIGFTCRSGLPLRFLHLVWVDASVAEVHTVTLAFSVATLLFAMRFGRTGS